MRSKDVYLTAALLGALSTISGEIVSKILTALGVGQYAVYELNSLLVLSNEPSLFMGFFVDCIVGGLVAILLYIIFQRLTGPDMIIVKCIVMGWLVWFGYEVLFTAIIEGQTIPNRPIIDHVVHIIATTAFGCTLGILFKAFLFKNQDKENTP